MPGTSRNASFKREIWRHYRTKGRHDLPWRATDDPYAILISEVMLQQTQVARVEGFYGRWLARFPDFAALARADVADVLAAWQGLGYNRRALALKRLAEIVMRDHAGRLPRDRAALEALPGIGKGTSGSLMAFAFNAPEPFIETNIRRVFIHFFFPRARHGVTDQEIARYIKETLDRTRPREWYWALMDYGAAMPAVNPNRRSAHYRRQSAFKGSDRELRGRVLRYLIAERDRTIKKKGPAGVAQDRLFAAVGAGASEERLARVLARLGEEGFIILKKRRVSLTK